MDLFTIFLYVFVASCSLFMLYTLFSKKPITKKKSKENNNNDKL